MDLSKIKTGENPPYDVNVVIEIPLGGNPVKYELDKVSGAMYVDRFLYTAMFYPGNYGFIPHTLAADGDPMDVIVLGPTAVVPGAVVRSRPVGALSESSELGSYATRPFGTCVCMCASRCWLANGHFGAFTGS